MSSSLPLRDHLGIRNKGSRKLKIEINFKH